MDHNNEDRKVPMVVNSVANSNPVRAVAVWAGLVITVAVLAIVGVAVWTVRAMLPLLGTTIVISLGIVVTVAVVWLVALVARFIVQSTPIHIGEFGTILNTWGRHTMYAPMAPANVRTIREKKNTVRVLPEMPTIAQMLGNEIADGQKDMLNGFDFSQNLLQAVRSEWPGTAIIAGRGGSGKTRRAILMIYQAIVGRAIVTICDPHATKDDSLAKLMEPFAPWLRIARGEREIVAAAREFNREMENRISSVSRERIEGRWVPRLVVYDEWARLMKTELIDDKEERPILISSVRESSSQYRGYGGYAWIISQEFTQDAIGDTAIRKTAHAIYCHQLSDEYAKFLFPRDSKTTRVIAQLERRDCIMKDKDNHVLKIVTPPVPDIDIPAMVEYLQETIPPVRQVEGTAQPAQVQAMPASKQINAPSHQSQQQQSQQGPNGADLDGDHRLVYDALARLLEMGQRTTIPNIAFAAGLDSARAALALQELAEAGYINPSSDGSQQQGSSSSEGTISAVGQQLQQEPAISQEERELQMVVNAWNGGATSIIKIMGATGLGQNRSRVLIGKAQGKSLIK
jgi:hypothetical protein